MAGDIEATDWNWKAMLKRTVNNRSRTFQRFIGYCSKSHRLTGSGMFKVNAPSAQIGFCEEAAVSDYIKPGLRGIYLVQSPKSRADINSIGNVMRIPCWTAVLRALSLALGRNADT